MNGNRLFKFGGKSLLKSIAAILAAIMAYDACGVPLSQAALLRRPDSFGSKTLPNTTRFNSLSNSLASSQPLNISPNLCRFPKTVAEVADVHLTPASTPVIYHLQDVHGSIPAQTNLAEMVSILEKYASNQGKTLLVAVEGASGGIDTDSIAAYPDPSRKEAVGAGLLRSGFLLGEEYAAITHAPGRIHLVGVENERLYCANVLAREDSKVAREKIAAQIKEIRRHLETLQPHNFSPALNRMEQYRKKVEEGSASLKDYLNFLYAIAPAALKDYPAVAQALGTVNKEASLDFKKINNETKRLLSDLIKDEKDDKQIEGLAQDAQALKTGALSPCAYYSKLLHMAKGDYPALQTYVSTLNDIERTKADELFSQIETVEETIAKGLIRHPMAYELYQHLRWAELQEKFFSLTLIPEEWVRVNKTGLKDLLVRQEAIRQFVREQVGDLGYRFRTPAISYVDLKPAFDGARRFYAAAEKRDAVMEKNVADLLSQYGSDRFVVAFIAGGFHTPGLTQLLRKRSLAYAVVRPQLETEIQLNQDYQFPNFRADLERYILMQYRENTLRSQPGLILNPGLVEQAMRDPRGVVAHSRPPAEVKPHRSGPVQAGSESFIGRVKRQLWGQLRHGPNDLAGLALLLAGAALAVVVVGIISIPRYLRSLLGARRQIPTVNQQSYQTDERGQLTEMDRLYSQSNRLLADLYREGSLDQEALAMARTYMAAMDMPGVFYKADKRLITVPDPEPNKPGKTKEIYDAKDVSVTIRDGVIFIPVDYVVDEINRAKGLEHLTFNIPIPFGRDYDSAAAICGSLNIPLTEAAFGLLKDWQDDRVQAGFMNPSKYHDSNALNKVYLRQLNEAIMDSEVQQRFFGSQIKVWANGKERAISVKDIFNDEIRRHNLDPKVKPAWTLLPDLFQIWRDLSFDEKAEYSDRGFAFDYMIGTIEFFSAVPKEMDSTDVEEVKLPAEGDLMGDENFRGSPGVDDVQTDGRPNNESEPYEALPFGGEGNQVTRRHVREAIQKRLADVDRAWYSGEFVHRIPAGGWARRLESDFPAALLNYSKAYKWVVDNGQFPSNDYPHVPILTRMIIQILTNVVEIAQRHGWDPADGLNNQIFVIPVNDEMGDEIVDHLQKLNFFGLPSHNFIFVSQQVDHGFDYVDKKFVETSAAAEEKGQTGTHGHGEPEFKQNMPNEAYFFTKKGDRKTLVAPLHQFIGSQHRIYNHIQVSFLDAINPAWVRDPNRYAIALAAIKDLGLSGTAEFRKDDTGQKGGMLGIIRTPMDSLKRFLGKVAGIFTVESSQVKATWGDAIKNKLQGSTVNASVVLVDARFLAEVSKPEMYPFIATVRPGAIRSKETLYSYDHEMVKYGKLKRKDGEHLYATIHPDTWSYWFYNLGRFIFWSPRNNRREIKEQRFAPQFLNDVRLQDSLEANPSYYYHEQMKWAQLKSSPISTLIFYVPGLLISMCGYRSPFLLLGAALIIIGLAIDYLIRSGKQLKGEIAAEDLVEDSNFDSRLVDMALKFSSSLGVPVKVKSGIWANAQPENNTLRIGSSLLLKSSGLMYRIRRFLLHMALRHEYVHFSGLQLPSTHRLFRLINEVIAYPVGLILVFLPSSLLFKKVGQTDGVSYAAEANQRMIPQRAENSKGLFKALQRGLQRDYVSAINAAGYSHVAVDLDSLRGDSDVEGFGRRLGVSFEIDQALHEQNPTERDADLVVYTRAPELLALAPMIDRWARGSKKALGYNLHFVGPNELEAWDGSINQLFVKAGIPAENLEGVTSFVITKGDPTQSSETDIFVSNLAYASLARYAYTHYSVPRDVLRWLVEIFKTFRINIDQSVSEEVEAEMLSGIQA